MDKNI